MQSRVFFEEAFGDVSNIYWFVVEGTFLTFINSFELHFLKETIQQSPNIISFS